MAEALVIVDFQNDFTPGGALGVPEGDAIAGRVNELAADDRFDLVVATRDWHPPDHGSFTEQGGIWPVHCVQNTPGAELYPGLDQANVDVVVDKGQPRDTEGYSGFQETPLEDLLRERGIDRITVVGLATDYCVKNTVLDARRLGFDVDVDASAIRAVDVEPGDGERAIGDMRAAGARVS
jgi:nicotinamidase/pyrazinamidase